MHTHISSFETVEETKAALKQKGLKITPARLLIISIMNDCHIPLRAEDIVKKLKGKKVDIATVYRTLSSLEEVGILKRVDLHKDSVFFELNNDHHHHMVCTSCGLIEDFDDCDVESLTKKVVSHSAQFKRIKQHSLELFGLCKRCVKV